MTLLNQDGVKVNLIEKENLKKPCLECRHFSQMIWRGSMEMGVARHWNTSNDCVAIGKQNLI